MGVTVIGGGVFRTRSPALAGWQPAHHGRTQRPGHHARTGRHTTAPAGRLPASQAHRVGTAAHLSHSRGQARHTPPMNTTRRARSGNQSYGYQSPQPLSTPHHVRPAAVYPAAASGTAAIFCQRLDVVSGISIRASVARIPFLPLSPLPRPPLLRSICFSNLPTLCSARILIAAARPSPRPFAPKDLQEIFGQAIDFA